MLFQRLPRKSEIATGLERSSGKRVGRGERERERSEGSEAWRERGEEEGVGRQETDDQTRLLVHPSSPSLVHQTLSSFCFVCLPLFFFSSSLPCPPFSLHYSQALDCFPAWLSSGRLAVQHHNQRFLAIFKTFYPNTAPDSHPPPQHTPCIW